MRLNPTFRQRVRSSGGGSWRTLGKGMVMLACAGALLTACQRQASEEPAPGVAEEVKTEPLGEAPFAIREAPEETSSPVVPATPEIRRLEPRERAAMLGFAAHLAKDTEGFFALYEMESALEEFYRTETWKALEEIGEEVEDHAEMSYQAIAKTMGKEIFLALGPGAAPQMESLMTLYRVWVYQQIRLSIERRMGESEEVESLGAEVGREVVRMIAEEFERVENGRVPPVLFGIRITDKDRQAQMQQSVEAILQWVPMMTDKAEEIRFVKGGVEFAGYRIPALLIADPLERDPSLLDGTGLSPDRLKEALETKEIIVSYGFKDDCFLYFVGDREEACPLVDSVEESLLANEAIRYVDGCAGKRVYAFSYVSENLMHSMAAPQIRPLAEGIRDGVSSLGDIEGGESLVALLDLLIEKEAVLLKMASTKAFGSTITSDRGLQFDLYDGVDWDLLDYDTPHRLAKLGSERAMIQGHWRWNPDHLDASAEFGEVLLGAFHGSGRVASPSGARLPEVLGLGPGFPNGADHGLSESLLLLKGIETAFSGLEGETALVVDGRGEMPAFPGVPQEMVDEGKFPRLSLVSPVVKREKLGEGWKLMERELRDALTEWGERGGMKIPMQKPVTSERDGLINYSFPIPFTSDDFNPSITVSDRWWAMTTSKRQSFELMAEAEKAGGTETGAWFRVDLNEVRAYLRECVDLFEKYGEKVFSEAEMETMAAEIAATRRVLEASKELEAIEFTGRREEGWVRHTLHFKAAEKGRE